VINVSLVKAFRDNRNKYGTCAIFSRFLLESLLPKRLEKFNLQVAPEKTRLLRFSRFHPSMKRRFTFLGFEFAWRLDRQGVPRVKRRTARKKLQAAYRRITAWIKQHRHLRDGSSFGG
jgi:hypothetical protein